MNVLHLLVIARLVYKMENYFEIGLWNRTDHFLHFFLGK